MTESVEHPRHRRERSAMIRWARAKPTRAGPGRTAGLVVVFLWFAIGGVAHFASPDTFVRIVPPWIPWPLAAVLVSGAFELLGAAGILWRPGRRLAGVVLVLLTIAVTPANVYMLQHAEAFPGVPHWALVARLPLQVALLALIVWSTWPARSSAT